MVQQLFCFGDSITYGAWDTQGGWVNRLRKRIDQHNIPPTGEFCLVYNQGVDSDTSSDLRQRLLPELQMYRADKDNTIIVCCIGINDSLRAVTTNALRVGPEKFTENIQAIICQARTISEKIVFLGNIPINENKTQPYQYGTDIQWANDDIQRYEQLTYDICQQEKTAMIPVFADVQQDYLRLLSDDGLHPNDVGHEYLAEKVHDYLCERAWI